MQRLLLLILIMMQGVSVQAMPVNPATGMVAQTEDKKIKNIGGNLYEIKDGDSSVLVRLAYNKMNTYTPINSDIPLIHIHKWQKEYKVSFDGRVQYVLQNHSAKEPPTPERKGYIFTGWDKDFTDITSDLEIKSTWKPKKYNVVFKDGSNVIKTEECDYNTKASPPEMKNEEGRTFTGWDKNLTVKSDTVFNATWETEEYTVTFDTGEVFKVGYMNDVLNVPVPQRKGYIFLGWGRPCKEIIDDTAINAIWKKDNGLVQFITARRPHSTEDSDKIKEIKEQILGNIQKGEVKKYYGDYNLLKKARDSINSEYFYYFSILDSSIEQADDKFYLQVNNNKDRFLKNQFIKTEIEKEGNKLKGLTEKQAVEELQKWLSRNFTYEKGQNSIYEALRTKKGNCDAYAQIVQAVCDYCGIECKYVTGYTKDGYHAWNIVKLNNENYYIDFTWDYGLSKELWADHVEESRKYYFEEKF